ncbi:MAG TPA: ABC transporter substrate-binding protein [Chthoniobacter sp.]|nr:ABC transporter substrate-binding protein [Chthoniobacter sp.]
MIRPIRFTFTLLALALLGLAASAGTPAPADKVEIAADISLTGDAATFGVGSLEGIKLAIEEANARGSGPQIELKVYDDKSVAEGARAVAAQVVASPAVVVIGPSSSSTSLGAGPIFAQAGLPSITTTATSDAITDSATTFRILFKNSDQGEMLATYLYRVLGQHSAAVMVVDDSYGRTLEKGFRSAAERLGIEAKYYVFKKGENMEEMAGNVAKQIGQQPVVLAMLDIEGSKILPVLRRFGVKGPFLGGDPFGVESFNSSFSGLPEEKKQPGYFTENLYGLTPMLLDSANAEMLSFAERFRTHFGHNPGWVAVAGYDAARAAVEAIHESASGSKPVGTAAWRAAALEALHALKEPARAPSGLLGPIAFDSARGRQIAVRIGRFNRGRFESAPLQIVSVTNPHELELKSGAVFEMQPERYARLQQVIYSGIYVNEILWIDQSHLTFGADLYVWIRYARNSGPEAADPCEIKFPELSSGHFDRERPVEQRDLEDGTSYRLWRVQAEFRNQFDLHRYPFDRQTLTLRFFNARADVDHIVYALDQSATDEFEQDASRTAVGISEAAFHGLSQWNFRGMHQRRDQLVTRSSLGDPRRVGRENYRELSGYAAAIDCQRQWVTTLSKNYLPLLLMTCMMYASLHFAPVLVQVKVTVAITGVLTGVVLLNAVNSQLGAIGYTTMVEYAFYVFFSLGLLNVVSVLIGEQLRHAGRVSAALKTDFWTRVVFLLAVVGLVVALRFHH